MIEEYSFGRVVYQGAEYTSDLVIYSDRVQTNWWRRRGHEVCAEDLADVLAAAPEIVVLGTGAHGLVNVLPDAEEALAAVGAKLIAEPTGAACETFNGLLGEGRRVVAALHLTC